VAIADIDEAGAQAAAKALGAGEKQYIARVHARRGKPHPGRQCRDPGVWVLTAALSATPSHAKTFGGAVL
jgi:hypothetical protein